MARKKSLFYLLISFQLQKQDQPLKHLLTNWILKFPIEVLDASAYYRESRDEIILILRFKKKKCFSLSAKKLMAFFNVETIHVSSLNSKDLDFILKSCQPFLKDSEEILLDKNVKEESLSD